MEQQTIHITESEIPFHPASVEFRLAKAQLQGIGYFTYGNTKFVQAEARQQPVTVNVYQQVNINLN